VQRNRRADGSTALTAERMAVLNRLVVAACGNPDGAVADPLACRFDPLRHVCAPAPIQVAACRRTRPRAAAAIYDGRARPAASA
jgi:hypothetical protein